jgi:hypothetical protein
MGIELTCQELISRVRNQVADRAAEVWTDPQVLQACDQALESVWIDIKMAAREQHLTYLDIPANEFDAVSDQATEWTPPESVGAIRSVAGYHGNATVCIPHVEVEMLPLAQRIRGPFYVRVNGRLRIFRNTFGTVRVWYVRRWPPLHYGEAGAASTDSALQFDPAPIGVAKARDIYEGARVEIMSGANQDRLVTILAFDTATMTATIDTLPAPIAEGDVYSLLVPVEGEHGDLVATAASMRLLERAGNTDYLSALMPAYGQHLERFRASINQQDLDLRRFV